MCKLFIEADPTLWENATRSLRIEGVVTSIRLEKAFWHIIEQIAQRDDLHVPQLISRLYRESTDAGHDLSNFTSFLRVCCMRYLSLQLSEDIPQDMQVPIASLDATSILQKEQWAQ